MSINHIKKFIEGSAIILLANVITGFLNYFIRRTLAINLTVKDFGFLYAAMSLAMLFLSYIDLGLSGSTTILIAKEYNSKNNKNANTYFNYIFYFKLGASLIILTFFILTYKFWLYDFLKYSSPLPFFIIMSLLVIQALSGTPNCVLNALQKFFYQSLPNILNPLLILIIIFLFDSGNINIAALSFPLSAVIVFFIALFITYTNGFYISLKLLKDLKLAKNLFHFSKWIAISTAGFYTLFYTDSLMLTWLSGLQSVGIYNVILPLVQIAISLLVFSAVFTPIATQLWVENKLREITEICNFMTLLSVYLLWPILISISYCAKPLINILFSEKYISGSNALIILFSSTVFLGLANFYASILNTGKGEKKVAICLILTSLINIILNFILIPLINISGAASATTISYVVLSFFLYFQLKNKLSDIKFPILKNAYFFIIGIPLLFFSFYIQKKINLNNFHVALSLILTILFYFVCTLPILIRIIKGFLLILKNK